MCVLCFYLLNLDILGCVCVRERELLLTWVFKKSLCPIMASFCMASSKKLLAVKLSEADLHAGEEKIALAGLAEGNLEPWLAGQAAQFNTSLCWPKGRPRSPDTVPS